MAGPTSPGSEGPTFGPPQLPPGWIAQWDGASRKYYFVQLSTGVSQWDVPTDAAPTGSTPAPPAGDHPYGVPRQQELITHPDGSQTVRHADGSLEPVNPPMPQDGSRGLGDGPSGDRGLGSMAMNLLGGKHSGGGGGGGGGSNPLGSLAGQFLGGGSGHGSSGSGLGKIGGALASSFLSSSSKPEQPQNFHGGNQGAGQQQQSHGLAGSIMGGVANMFGGGKPNQGGSNFGYSNAGGEGGYSGQAPPASYQPSGHRPTTTGSSSYQQTQPSPQQSFPPPPGQPTSNQKPTYEQPGNHQSHPTFGQVPPPPAGGPPASSYGQGSSYGTHPQQQNHHQSYGGNYDPSSYGGGPPGGYPGAYSNGPSQQNNQGAYGARY